MVLVVQEVTSALMITDEIKGNALYALNSGITENGLDDYVIVCGLDKNTKNKRCNTISLANKASKNVLCKCDDSQ